MPGFLQQLLRRRGAQASQAPEIEQQQLPGARHPIDPPAHAQPTAQEAATPAFVRREPVLNRQQHIAGYSFALQGGLQPSGQPTPREQSQGCDDVLLRSIAALDTQGLIGERQAFIHLTPASLHDAMLAELPARNTVLLLTPGHSEINAARLAMQIDALRARGFAIGWALGKAALARHPQLLELAAQADCVQLQIGGFDGMDVKLLSQALLARRQTGRAALLLMAQGLHSYEEFSLCYQGGFDLFLGAFITRRDDWHPPRSEINRELTLRLLHLLRSDTDNRVIAEHIARDPVMTFKLLRYLHSPAIGLADKVLTIDKGLMILGRTRSFRWLSLLLYDINHSGYRERVLTEQALTRAFFLEALAGQGKIANDRDGLFILGLFSLLDVLTGHPLPALLAQTRLPAPLHDALLGAAGTYHSVLQLAIANEGYEDERMHALALDCGVDAQQVFLSSVRALERANQAAVFEI